ncbi:MAG: tetratricopeptide repeat protein [Burkholderiales bacterium]|nr:tetratricopeptide repeat protein [Burkholderiales bacterium]MDE1927831.1 tetratricopeptide repeat protein [Burkholderiales bacterium]MDE2159708.1 tetratricopeptide repeat protein [Burkholderiales bacterium]MDE2501912.1 tetratricopeptide repeat protein [Burkholderiales bacterium]
MATQLDLQEQEQLDALKAFWKQQGNLITWVLILVLGAFAAWNGWQYWQRKQATQAGAIFEALDRAAGGGELDKAEHIFGDLKDRYPGTAWAEQGGLLTAKLESAQGRADAAQATLSWVAEHATEDEYRTIARLRLAAMQADAKHYDAALATLDAAKPLTFGALIADRRGDILLAQGKKEAARAAYQEAWKGMDAKVEYRRLIDAKLTALGAAPDAAPAASAASGAAR